MNPDEYARMFELEDRYWWFVGRRRLALRLLDHATGGLRSVATRADGAAPSTSFGASGELTSVATGVDGATPSTFLDLGCGTGVVLTELQKRRSSVGVDMSPLALEFCRRRGLTRLVRGDATGMPLIQGSCQAIIALDVFEHIEDDRRAFAESLRSLAPGGILILSVPAFQSLWGPHDIALMHFRRYTRHELRVRLEEAGFEVVRLSYSVFVLFPIVVIVRFFEKRKRGPAKASLAKLPNWMNTFLIGIQSVEAALISRINLPWGSSLIAVVRRPK
jgi:SAM-dependent methyltransferase